MPLFAITFEPTPGRNYQPLRDELDNLGALQALPSCYLADLNFTAEDLKTHLKSLMDINDKLLVVAFTGAPAYFGASLETNDWIALHR